jgi:hypothetical protein
MERDKDAYAKFFSFFEFENKVNYLHDN